MGVFSVLIGFCSLLSGECGVVASPDLAKDECLARIEQLKGNVKAQEGILIFGSTFAPPYRVVTMVCGTEEVANALTTSMQQFAKQPEPKPRGFAFPWSQQKNDPEAK